MLYAVYRVGKKVRWKSLKTQDIAVARGRANIGIRFRHQAEKVIRSVAEANDIDLSSPPLPPSPAAQPTAHAAPQAQPPKVASHTLKETWEAWKRTWAIAQGTRETREAHWNMLGRVLKPETPLRSITFVRLKEVQAALKDSGLSPVSINDVMFKSLRRCLENAVDAGWLADNPAAKLKPLKRKEVIREQPTWEEAWKLVEEAIKTSPESGEILRFMLAFGVGQKEVKSLRGEHIDFQRREVNFIRQKTGKRFHVPIVSHSEPVLEALKAAGRIQTGKPVFDWRDPEQALHGACLRLNMPVYTPRSLRRTYIIHYLESGIEPRTVAKWQGHRDAKLILDTYGAYVSKEHEQAQVAKLDGKR